MKFLKKNKTFIVAEIGNNHEGNINTALKLVDKAKEAGADAVKFQTYQINKFLSKNYDKKSIKRLKKFSFTYDQFYKIRNYCKKKNITFFSTPLDIESAIFLNKIQNIFKISSGDNNYYDLIKVIKSFKKPIIISSGLLNETKLKILIKFITHNWLKNKEALSILHCTTSYPVEKNYVNLRVIPNLIHKYKNIVVGYSDHTIGIDAAVFASVLGAKIIEKHFTLDKNFSDFRDHKLSADPKEMKDLISKINLSETLLGNSVKKIQFSEKKFLLSARRSLAVNKDFSKNYKLRNNDLVFLRPNLGFTKRSLLVGKNLKKNIKKEMIIKKDYI